MAAEGARRRVAAARRQGVIHRDLKPGNVMLTKTGAKLLDFGLAKLAGVRGGDIHIMTVENGKPRMLPLFETPSAESWPVFSPDGRWLAYGSDASGRFEIYVRPYPGPGAATQVSIDGGWCPT